MKISIVTAVYNRAATIAQSVRSTLRQTHDDIELIVQDGCSSDGTMEVLRGIDDARMTLFSEEDEGIYDALNRGLVRARGEVLGLMHSDDYFAHDRVLEQVADALSDPLVDGVYGDLVYVSADVPSRVIRTWKAGPYSPQLLYRGWMPPHPTLYLRREVFEKWGRYDTQYQIAADYDAILRWLIRGKIRLRYIGEVMVVMRTGGESNRSPGRLLRKSYEDYLALKRNGVGGLYTLASKNISKISQFWKRS